MENKANNVILWEDEEVATLPERVRLNNAVGNILFITHAEKRISERFGEYVVIKIIGGLEYYTFSKLVLEQYDKLSGMINSGYTVKTKVKVNNNNQVYFGVAE